jgi:peptide/nickel transport system ATP-binding protein
MTEPLLQVRDLIVHLRFPSAVVLDRVGFDLGVGETIGILGESGAGKTTLAKALLRLLPPDCWQLKGSIRFRGSEILHANQRELRKVRGAQISLISQEPELALNPVMSLGKQADEVLRAHSSLDRRCRREEVDSILAAVGLPERHIARAYPHELSGGQRQRAAIALSLISKPSLLIADEPTSALDNLTQAAVLDLLKRIRDHFRLALLFITHNPALLNGLADRVLVMRGGRIIEAGALPQTFWEPNHPYTQELLKSIPPMPDQRQSPPEPLILTAELLKMDVGTDRSAARPLPILEVQHLRKQYLRGPWLSAKTRVTALEDVNLSVWPRSTLALVGKSGAGKSTLGRCVALLEEADSGHIRFQGRDVLALRRNELAAIRRDIQFVFQQSATAMNPGFKASEVVAEPLRIEGSTSKNECRKQALASLEKVGIAARWADRPPLEFSGGQRQRIAIARALILKPKLLVLDEAFSGLDVCTQMQIADMLIDLQASQAVSYLFISHDLRMAAYLADTIAVIEHGRIVEIGSAAGLFSLSQRKETRELIDAIPRMGESAANAP